jgi:osmotically-inducible protein OsmY
MDEDLRLQGRVRHRLARWGLAWVRAEVEAGVVYLEGVVASAAEKHRLEQRLRRVRGVRGVINCLALEHVAAQR